MLGYGKMRFMALVTLALLPACGEGDEGASEDLPRPMERLTQPLQVDDCITDVGAGDHTFECGGITFLVRVDELCTRYACGLIFDVHGGTMSGRQMRDNTHLDDLGAAEGFIVVHPSATPENTGGSWDLRADPPVLGDFMDRAIDAYQVDRERVHVTGFSQGSGVTFWFLCHKPELLASTAPISGQSADSIVAPDGSPCVEFIDADWQPRVPIFFMNGIRDGALEVDAGRARVASIVERLGLSEGEQIAGDDAYTRTRYTGDDGMVFDYLEHDYGGQAVLDGHCIPGGDDVAGAENNFGLNATTCTEGDIQLDWGQLAMEWFLAHPKQGAQADAGAD